ncbi:MAG: formate--phosphoribosylaminoimidazolecarboxamide ligase [Candidatus Gracilibacteria bacterium]|nr:formate--phosphoribosylaminoimidazolecarboxamide ligase [Candidatus Gracilibacteria bacterium]
MGNIKDYHIATLGSHTALQILKGAKDEGFKTICVCEKGSERPYKSYGVADEIISIDSFKDYFKIEPQLVEKNAILIPHGSFVAHVGAEKAKDIKAMHYGARGILEHEADRGKQRQWLVDAGIKVPKIIKTPQEIDRTVIIKFHGAKGGYGYFLANNEQEFAERIKEFPENDGFVIQEYIVGVPVYAHYFYSRLTGELEIMGFDKRYESNADSIGRIAAKDQVEANIHTTYTIVGNTSLVVRESLLTGIFEMGDKVVAQSKNLVPGGFYGPFCLEGVIDPELNYYVFEISARIVAGTNPYVNGSPYTALRYNEPMSTGRRLCRDIKMAIEGDRLGEILG